MQTGHIALNVSDVGRATRVREHGGGMHHDGVVAHREGSESGGIFFTDPDGIRLEIYAPSGSGGHAPHGEAPTCGFF
jgi:lactoylglutathione lyase